MLPGFTLLEPLHESTEAALRRAIRDADGAEVSIRISVGASPRRLAALLHELSILRDLDVAGVPKARSLEKFSDRLALVTDRVEGEPLSELLARGPLELRDALRIGAELARITGRIHDSGIIHKDIKPEHIYVLSGEHRLSLVGFHIATRLSQETQRVVSPEALEGTLAYMSPEQTGRMNRSIDRRTDLYSIGVTLYEMLTGAPPFGPLEPMELVHAHIARAPASPHERAAVIPEAVSRVVMKLLSKNAEDRYQSAGGLARDLERCASELEETGGVRVFPLGAHDVPDTLRIPEKLYGRGAEERALIAAFERVATGGAELLIVSGYSGIGKSALVNEIHKAIARKGGYFASGKFDLLGRTVPYAPLASAFRELVRHILGEPEERLRRRREQLEAAFGQNGALVSELIPELDLVMGPQPPVPALGPAESQNRFNLVFKNFVQAFATAEHPLVLFLDDLQWVDPASLKLLEMLLDEPRCPHLLLIVAYRDNEVDAAHPLRAAIEGVRRGGATVTEISLGALELADVADMLAETMAEDRDAVMPLARVVFERTHNNPFFVKQFLRALHAEELVRFDEQDGRWVWDREALRRRPSTENVVDFLAQKIRQLPGDVQRVLELGASIGHQFDLRTLSLVHERPPEETAAALWGALEAGLVLPVDSEYRLVHGISSPAASRFGDVELAVRYRFQHDRVQQAAYSLVEPEKRPALHLAIGRILLAGNRGEQLDTALFDVVNHLNVGAALIQVPEERAELAGLNLRAGRKAKAATAYQAALGYFRTGMSLLPEDAWSDHYELTLALHRERSEAAYLNGHFDEAERLYPVAVANARTAMDKVSVYFTETSQYQTQGRYREAIAIESAGLDLLGWTVPEGRERLEEALRAEIRKVDELLEGRAIEDLLDAPRMESVERGAMLEILQIMLYSAYLDSNQVLANLALAKMTTLSIEHGNSSLSPFGYIGYAMVLGALLDDFEKGYRFAKMGIDLSERFDDVAKRCQANFLFAADVHSWTQPIARSDLYYGRAYDYGLESGDWVTVGYMIIQSGSDRLTRGMPLADLDHICESHLAFLERAKNRDVIDLLRAGVIQPMRNLQGRTEGPGTFDGDGFREAEYLAKYAGSAYYESWLRCAQIRSAYLFDQRHRFAELASMLDVLKRGVPTHAKIPEATFYAALMRVALGEDARDHDERTGHTEELRKLEERLERWARCGPSNVMHKWLLVQAERARVDGRRLEAMDLYERAILLAGEDGYINNQALANELYGRFWLGQGRGEIASLFLQKARGLYEQWGAHAKAAHLRERHPMAFPLMPGIPTAPAVIPDVIEARSGSSRRADALDWMTVLQAAQAIASEMELERVIDRLMRIMIYSVGATRGVLILARDDELSVEASVDAESDLVAVGPSVPIDERSDLPRTVIHYVARTREAVVLGSASADGLFSSDPYFAVSLPKSVLCAPLLYQGKIVGVLYLENHLAEGVFGEERIELVELLASQAAVALQNAMLYEHLQSVTADLRRSKGRLEEDVRERTHELREANERLAFEFEERLRAEVVRTALQEEMIRMQREQLAELSTPLIPVTDRIMVMPLVGSMDLERAAQVLETALRGASARGAKVVILDVTGLRRADASVVTTLIRAAKALRLLGTEAMMTGVRPDMAQTFVDMGIELGGITTMGTLQSGIAHALRRTGERPMR